MAVRAAAPVQGNGIDHLRDMQRAMEASLLPSERRLDQQVLELMLTSSFRYFPIGISAFLLYSCSVVFVFGNSSLSFASSILP